MKKTKIKDMENPTPDEAKILERQFLGYVEACRNRLTKMRASIVPAKVEEMTVLESIQQQEVLLGHCERILKKMQMIIKSAKPKP